MFIRFPLDFHWMLIRCLLCRGTHNQNVTQNHCQSRYAGSAPKYAVNKAKMRERHQMWKKNRAEMRNGHKIQLFRQSKIMFFTDPLEKMCIWMSKTSVSCETSAQMYTPNAKTSTSLETFTNKSWCQKSAVPPHRREATRRKDAKTRNVERAFLARSSTINNFTAAF